MIINMKKTKKTYIKPVVDTININFDDIISTSGCSHESCAQYGCLHNKCAQDSNNQALFDDFGFPISNL